jgi:hypothetical protein
MRDTKRLPRAATERVVLTRQQDDVTVAVHWKNGGSAGLIFLD